VQRTQNSANLNGMAIAPSVNAAAALEGAATTEVATPPAKPVVSRRAHVLAASSAKVRASSAGAVASVPAATAGWLVGPAKWLNPKDFGPVLGAVVWAVNEWQYQVGGLKPILNPNRWPSATVAAGAAGTLGAYGPFGNPLTFSVTTQPVNGTVTVSPQGTWAYTADPGYGAAGSTDSFTVTATDSAFHLENLFGLPGHQTTVTVPVIVDSQATVSGTSNTVQTVWNRYDSALQVAGYLTDQAMGAPAVGTIVGIGESVGWILPPYNNHIDILLNPVGVYHEGILDNYNVGSSPFGVATGTRVGSDTGTKVYVTNYYGGGVTVINPAYCQVCGPLNPGPGGYNSQFIPTGANPNAIAFNGNRALLYVTNSGSGTVSQIYTGDDTNQAGVIKTIDVGLNPVGVAIGPGGNQVYVTNLGSNSVSQIDNNTGAVLNTINLGANGSNPFGVAVSGDGRVWVANSGSNTVAVIDPNGAVPQVTDLITVGGTPIGVAVNGRDGNIWVAAETGMVSVINPNTNAVVANIPVVRPQNIVISPDGAYAYVTNAGVSTNTMTTIDTATQAIVNVVSTGGSDAQGIAVDPSGYQVYVASSNSNTVAEIGVGLAGQTGDGGIAYYTVSAYSDNSGYHQSCTASRGLTCDASTVYANTYLAPAPGQTIVITDPSQQNQILAQYSDVTYTYADPNGPPTGGSVTNGEWRTDRSGTGFSSAYLLVQSTGVNTGVYDPGTGACGSCTEVQYSATSSHTASTNWSDTIGGSASVKTKEGVIFASAEETITVTEAYTWGKSYNDTSTNGTNNKNTIPPNYLFSLWNVVTVERFYGDWTIRANGVTYLLQNMYIDAPSGGNSAELYIPWNCPTSSQCAIDVSLGAFPEDAWVEIPGYTGAPQYFLDGTGTGYITGTGTTPPLTSV
jgi:YVTN family beta-propeller protein